MSDEESSVAEDTLWHNGADVEDGAKEKFHFEAFFGNKLAFEDMSSTDLSTFTPDATNTPPSNEQKELDGLLQSTRGGDSLDILLKLNRSMSIIVKMGEDTSERNAREIELEQSLQACGYHRKNPGELGRAIIVARYMSKRADLIEWLNKKPSANDMRPHPRILSRIKEAIFLDTYLLDRLFHHLRQPFAWTREEVKKLGDSILEQDTVELSEWSIRDAKIHFHVLHVENAHHLARVVRWERVPFCEDVLHNNRHWQSKVDAAMIVIRTFTLTGIEEKEGKGLTLTFNHDNLVRRISCDHTASLKAINVNQWTRYLETEAEGILREAEQRKRHSTDLRTENHQLKARLRELEARNAQLEGENETFKARNIELEDDEAEGRKEHVRVYTSLLLVEAFVSLEGSEWAALEEIIPGLLYRAFSRRWADKAEFSVFFQSKIDDLVAHGKDVTHACYFQQVLDDRIEKYNHLRQPLGLQKRC